MAASPLIPKAQQSAYQRWELGSFDAPKPQAATAAPTPAQSAASAERVRQITEKAQAEGYAAGHREGLEAARLEAHAEADARAARIDEMLASLTSDLKRIDQELAQEVVQLGLAVARKLIGEGLRVRPEMIKQSVEDALRHVAHIRGPITLAVNPADALIVRSYLETAPPVDGWSLREDASIAAGGCRVETAAGEVDSTLAQRWHRITAALGQPTDWID
jgi:flagellar assembly protein FliH